MIVVTGAAGLIGSAVVRELNRLSYTNLLLVDHLGEGEKWKNLRSLSFSQYMEKDEFIDLIKEAKISGTPKALKGIKAIIHLGANSSTTESNASFLIQNNYRYSQQIAHFAEVNHIRMVYASSAATYGDGSLGFLDNSESIQSLRPLNMYGYSKQLFDLHMLKKNWKPFFVGLKYFNIFGPNEYHKGDMRSLVLKAFEQIKQDGILKLFKSYNPMYEDGKQMRDFLYVDDAAQMTVFFAVENTRASGIFNVGRGEANTWLELGAHIFNSMQLEKKVQFIEMPEAIKPKYQYFTCANMEAMYKANYRMPFLSLKEAVNRYITNFLLRGYTHA